MTIFLERVDAFPVDESLSPDLMKSLTVMVDVINSAIQEAESAFNLLAAPPYTTAEITILAPTVPNGTFFYDTTVDELKTKKNGSIVEVLTT